MKNLSIIIIIFFLLCVACSDHRYIVTSGPKMNFSIYNLQSQQIMPSQHPLEKSLNKVELPPYYTIAANVPSGVGSVQFLLNGKKTVIDNEFPFLYSDHIEDSSNVFIQPGTYKLEARAFTGSNASGPKVVDFKQNIFISDVGWQAAGIKMSPEETEKWINSNIDALLVKKQFQASNGLTMPYRLYLPSNYSERVVYPLLIYLHGRGQRGTDNGPELYNKSTLFMGSNSILSPANQEKYCSIIFIPQCSDKTINEEWAKWVGNSPETPFQGLGDDGSYHQAEKPSDSGMAVLELLDSLLNHYSVDRKRVYICGISMGGFGTWELTSRRPELFAAAIPMAGYSDPDQIQKIKHIPFWIFHGGSDTVNPPEGSRNMYYKLKEANAQVRYSEYPALGHSEAFENAWGEKELLPWLFSQRRK